MPLFGTQGHAQPCRASQRPSAEGSSPSSYLYLQSTEIMDGYHACLSVSTYRVLGFWIDIMSASLRS